MSAVDYRDSLYDLALRIGHVSESLAAIAQAVDSADNSYFIERAGVDIEKAIRAAGEAVADALRDSGEATADAIREAVADALRDSGEAIANAIRDARDHARHAANAT